MTAHSSEKLPYVTVVIPMRNEERNIARCLKSILAGDYPRDCLEVLVLDGMSSDGSRDVVLDYSERHPWIRLLNNPRRIQSAALNTGLKEARGEIIVRMDAHSTYDQDYISRCVELLQKSDAANVGGVQKAMGTSYLTRAIALATTSRYGIGDAKFRYARTDMWVDTVYLGAWRKRTLEAAGGFNESLRVNEDYELNCRLRKAGGRILFSPGIVSAYRVRGSLWGLARQYFRYGFWKVRMLSAHPESLRWRQLVPPALVISLAVSLALVPLIWPLSLLAPALYGMYLFIASRRIAQHRRHLLILPIVLAALHIGWGTGFVAGLARWGIPRWRPATFLKAFTNRDLEVGV